MAEADAAEADAAEANAEEADTAAVDAAETDAAETDAAETDAADADAVTLRAIATQSTAPSSRARLLMIFSGLGPQRRSAGNLTLFPLGVLFAGAFPREKGASNRRPLYFGYELVLNEENLGFMAPERHT